MKGDLKRGQRRNVKGERNPAKHQTFGIFCKTDDLVGRDRRDV